MSAKLTAAELTAVNRPTGSAHGLPNRFYTATDAGQAERDSVLGTGWTCIGFVGELEPGEARPEALMGLPLMVVKDLGGTVRVFHNVCRHRGHRLVSEPCKFVGVIRCPYHSWTYGYDGTLKGTPHIGGHGIHEVEGFDKANRGLVEVRSAVWLGMLFVNLSGAAPPLQAFLAPLIERWQPFVGEGGLDALVAAGADGRFSLEMECNWKLAIENYCESYHLPWVHPGLNSYSKIQDHYNIVMDGWGAGQGTRVFNFTERSGITLPRFQHWPEEQLKIAEYIAVFPNLLLGLQNDHLFAIAVKPLAPNRTSETVQLYYLQGAATESEYAHARKVMLEGWREVFREDVSVCKGMQDGRVSPAFDGGAFSPALDVSTHHFHQWVASRLPVAGEGG